MVHKQGPLFRTHISSQLPKPENMVLFSLLSFSTLDLTNEQTKTPLLSYNSYTIQFTYMKYTIHCFLPYIQSLYNHQNHLTLEHFFLLQETQNVLLSVTPHSNSSLHPTATTNLLSVFMDLLVWKFHMNVFIQL